MARLVDGVEIAGPYNPTGVSRTPSRALIFVCDPKKTGEPACARQITENLARRAFRRPVTAEDVARLMPFYEAGREDGGSFDQGIEQVVAAVLASPEFLYRAIRGPKGASPEHRVCAHRSGTGFAPFLLPVEYRSGRGTADARRGGRVNQARSGGKTGEAHAGGSQGLQPGHQFCHEVAEPRPTLDSVKPDPMLFPGFNEQLRHDFSTEAEAFISSILLEDRSVVDLLTADHTFLNERLARHYGISGVIGTQFRKVTLAEKERCGPAGQGRDAAADFLWRPHLSGVAGSVGAR